MSSFTRLSRRGLIASAAAIAVSRRSEAQAKPLRVQFTPGGHTVPLQLYAMFSDDSYKDIQASVLPHPDAFREINSPNGPDVVVTCDWITGSWPDNEKQPMQKYL